LRLYVLFTQQRLYCITQRTRDDGPLRFLMHIIINNQIAAFKTTLERPRGCLHFAKMQCNALIFEYRSAAYFFVCEQRNTENQRVTVILVEM
jgi:hypothetical protein